MRCVQEENKVKLHDNVSQTFSLKLTGPSSDIFIYTIFTEKTFTNSHKTSKFVKVFSTIRYNELGSVFWYTICISLA